MLHMKRPTTYTIIDGIRPDDAPAHMQRQWHSGRMNLARNRVLQGEFAAHVIAWRAIQHAGDDGAIVLEDDCVVYRPRPLTSAQYPLNAITLLGDCFRGFRQIGSL